MTLRRKLFSIFLALGALVLMLAVVTVWVTNQWQKTNELIEHHYQRSLLLKSVRSLAFRASNELYDGLSGTDIDAREEFEELIKPAESKFQQWAELAHNADEEKELKAVRSTFLQLEAEMRTVFDLLEAGRTVEARIHAETDLDDGAFPSFDRISEAAVQSDARNRSLVKQKAEDVINRAKIVLAVTALATIIFLMLFAGYLGSDLFGPLRVLYEGLTLAAKGSRDIQLDTERNDELGHVNRAFNRLMENFDERERSARESVTNGPTSKRQDATILETVASRLRPRKLIAKLEAKVRLLNATAESKSAGKALLKEIHDLIEVIERVTAYYLPLDLQLKSTDVRRLLYDVAAGFHQELARRGASLSLEVTADVGSADIDAAKLYEAFSELMRLALKGLPEQDPRVHISAFISADDRALVIEIADNGSADDQRVLTRDPLTLDMSSVSDDQILVEVARAIIERHHGRLEWLIEPGQGATARVTLTQIASG